MTQTTAPTLSQPFALHEVTLPWHVFALMAAEMFHSTLHPHGVIDPLRGRELTDGDNVGWAVTLVEEHGVKAFLIQRRANVFGPGDPVVSRFLVRAEPVVTATVSACGWDGARSIPCVKAVEIAGSSPAVDEGSRTEAPPTRKGAGKGRKS